MARCRGGPPGGDRPGAARPAGVPACPAATGLCVWPDCLRRDGGAGVGGQRTRGRPDQNRAVRPHWDLRRRRTMEPLDGNAIAGSLLEYFGGEMTLVRGTCRHCGITARIAEMRVYSRAPGAVGR